MVVDICVFLISLVLFYFIYKSIKRMLTSERVKSDIDNRHYLVRNTKFKKESANTLATINLRIKKLIHHLSLEPPCKFSKNKKLLQERYKEDSISENIDLVDTSYTINKGESISFCLATRDSEEKVYDIDKIMYVVLHELSHVGCESIGHGEEFTNFFKFLVEKGVVYKVYQYTDYSKQPYNYCGLEITHNIL